jgi:hypothetical protein
VRIAEHLDRGEIPRDDVAAVLFTVLDKSLAIGKTFDLVSGDEDIGEALSRLA